MKTHFFPFIVLVATGITATSANASASIEPDSHPHLRALVNAAIDRCECSNNKQCDATQVCSGGCGTCCPAYHCNSKGDGCPSGATCDTSFESPSNSGCYGCRIALEEGAEFYEVENAEEEEELDVGQDTMEEVNSLQSAVLKDE